MIKNLNILLVDDHVVVRNGVKLMLSQQDSFAANIVEAEDGLDAINKIEKENFDIILMDIGLPKKDGISTTEYLIKKYSNLNILAFTMHDEDFMIKKMISAGALGYVLKSTRLEELTNAILTVSQSKRYYSNEVSQSLINNNFSKQIDVKKNQLKNESLVALSTREKEILGLITQELTNLEISEKLSISKRTVEWHRKNIFQKLNLKSSTALIKYAIANGITN